MAVIDVPAEFVAELAKSFANTSLPNGFANSAAEIPYRQRLFVRRADTRTKKAGEQIAGFFDRVDVWRHYAWKELPQPQDLTALGFSK